MWRVAVGPHSAGGESDMTKVELDIERRRLVNLQQSPLRCLNRGRSRLDLKTFFLFSKCCSAGCLFAIN